MPRPASPPARCARAPFAARALGVVTACVVLAGGAPPAAAQQGQTGPTGDLSVVGEVTVGGSFIDFLPPPGRPTGGIIVAPSGSTGTFAALAGTGGTIRDLGPSTAPAGVPVLLPGFVTLAAAPDIRFDLTMLLLGPYAAAACELPPAAGQTCTPAGSPFAFTNHPGGSTLRFDVRGMAVNTATGLSSPFTGIFRAEFPLTPYQPLVRTLAAGGALTTGYSALFTVTAVPEPATLGLLATGLAGGAGIAGVTARRRRRAPREGQY